MKINEYPELDSIQDEDLFIVQTPTDGTKKIAARNLKLDGSGEGTVTLDPAIAHRNTFRGKNLGTTFTDEQKSAIQNGTFDDLYVGDYWEINNYTWRIADIDYWKNFGDISCVVPHIIVVPDTKLYNTKMFNSSGNLTGAYYGSDLYTSGLNNAKNLIKNIFGESNILNHRETFTNAVNNNGVPIGSSWYDTTVNLMTENMVYGNKQFGMSISDNSSVMPAIDNINYKQLSLFQLNPNLIPIGEVYWLRDLSKGYFCAVGGAGHSNFKVATDSYGVRPVFGVTG